MWLSQCFKLSPILLSFQPSSPTLSPLNPNGNPELGHSQQASTCQGVPVQSTHRDTGMCTKAVTAFHCCQYCAGGYLPHRSPNWPTVAVWSLILLNDFLFPPTFLLSLNWDLQKAWQVSGLMTQKHPSFQRLKSDTAHATNNSSWLELS